MKKKTVILAGKQIHAERNDEIDFRPGKRAQNADCARTKSVDQHQENDADDDSGMGDKETDEAQIRKSKPQIWRKDRLQRSTDSPKVSHFEPAPIAGPKSNDDHDHRPVA